MAILETCAGELLVVSVSSVDVHMMLVMTHAWLKSTR